MKAWRSAKTWLPRAWPSRVAAPSRRARLVLAFALQAAALVVLALALAGIDWLDRSARPRVLVLVDRSESMPRGATDAALAGVAKDVRSAGHGEIEVLDFAGRPGSSSGADSGTAAALDPATTNIEAALDAALAAHARKPLAGAVVISDGWENAGDARRGLRAARDARLPVRLVGVAREAPETRVADVLAPARVLVHQPILLGVQLAGRLDRSLAVKGVARAVNGERQEASAQPDAGGRATLAFEARQAGALVFDVVLEDAASGRALDAQPDAAAVDVAPRGQVLYARGSPGPLAQSLRDGGWPLEVIASTQLDAQADALATYRAVVLDDVATTDASPRFWRSLVEAVEHRGIGLMVLGGERSFGRGGYRGSTLESILPVTSEPAALGDSLSVAFAVDKSGSMGERSGGVDRLRLAERAVLETARTLTDRDSLSLVVFDVAASVLIPLTPAAQAMAPLSRDWPVTPHGGTRAVPGLVAAMDQLARSGASRRMLVIVTDGFLDGAPVAALRTQLERAHIEVIALGIGPDADLAALQDLVGPGSGTVLHVNEAADLPLAMRSTLERRRGHVERGTIAVTQSRPLPFERGVLPDWPAIAAYPVTRVKAEATAAVQSERGDPVIAFQASGLGRVVAVTPGLGAWSAQWLGWREWSRLAGGLTAWISGTPQDGTLGLTVSDGPLDLDIQADARAASGWADGQGVVMAATTPGGQARVLRTDNVAPGRVRATLPDEGPGLYTLAVTTPLGTQRILHLRRRHAEAQTWGINPAVEEWRSAGLVDDGREPAWAHGAATERRSIDRSLLALGLALCLAGVLADRAHLPRWQHAARTSGAGRHVAAPVPLSEAGGGSRS